MEFRIQDVKFMVLLYHTITKKKKNSISNIIIVILI